MFRRANIKLMIYEIEGIPAISRVNPHVPTPCIIPPCTDRPHHRLNNFPNTVSIYIRVQTPPPCVTFYARSCGATDAPIFSVTCFLSLSFRPSLSTLSLHFPFRWTVARISISRHSNSTLFFSSRLLPIFYFFFPPLSFFLFHKKINRGRRISRKPLPSFLSFLFFLFSPLFAQASQRQRSLILNCDGDIYIYIDGKSIAFDLDRYTRECIESQGAER